MHTGGHNGEGYQDFERHTIHETSGDYSSGHSIFSSLAGILGTQNHLYNKCHTTLHDKLQLATTEYCSA